MNPKILVSIVTEASIEKAVIEAVLDLGADSYTTTDVRGRGPRRNDHWEPKEYRAVRIDVLCDDDVGRAVAAKLTDQYFRGYSMTITLSEVSLLRSHPS